MVPGRLMQWFPPSKTHPQVNTFLFHRLPDMYMLSPVPCFIRRFIDPPNLLPLLLPRLPTQTSVFPSSNYFLFLFWLKTKHNHPRKVIHTTEKLKSFYSDFILLWHEMYIFITWWHKTWVSSGNIELWLSHACLSDISHRFVFVLICWLGTCIWMTKHHFKV